MPNNIIDIRNHKKQIEKVLKNFYQAYYLGDKIKLYSYLDTNFQKSIPLNYFLIHSDYDVELGFLEKIINIEVYKEKNQATALVLIEIRKRKVEFDFFLKMDYGGWKLEGDNLYMLRQI